MKFKVVSGSHRVTGQTFPKGSVVESTVDLVKLHGRDKYECVSGDAVATEEPKASGDDYDHMTVAQLKEVAEQDEIDITGCKNKAEIVATLRSSDV